ncbi:MAG: hypothetical protein M0P99_03680 [Candidatus Cloacimonetes bacterium]|nr:hypothetical protein [Candidatus Cloacimonadota bacterium]
MTADEDVDRPFLQGRRNSNQGRRNSNQGRMNSNQGRHTSLRALPYHCPIIALIMGNEWELIAR